MTATYLGSFSVGAAIPGISATLDEVGIALQGLHLVVDEQLPRIHLAIASINGQASACLDAKAAIRIPACADFEAQLNAALDLSASFTLQLSDPVLYLNGLLAGLVQVQANLSGLVPTIALDTQISATAALAAQLSLKIEAVDLQLSALLAISLGLSVIAEALLAISVALSAALAACSAAISAYLTMAGHLASAGAHCFVYDGPLADLGAELSAVTPSAGISGSVPVLVPIVIVRQDNTAAVNGVNAVFRVA